MNQNAHASVSLVVYLWNARSKMCLAHSKRPWTVYVQLTTSHQLTKVLLELVKQYKLKEKELLDFQRDIEQS